MDWLLQIVSSFWVPKFKWLLLVSPWQAAGAGAEPGLGSLQIPGAGSVWLLGFVVLFHVIQQLVTRD